MHSPFFWARRDGLCVDSMIHFLVAKDRSAELENGRLCKAHLKVAVEVADSQISVTSKGNIKMKVNSSRTARRHNRHS